jgi:hypothetical protein
MHEQSGGWRSVHELLGALKGIEQDVLWDGGLLDFFGVRD